MFSTILLTFLLTSTTLTEDPLTSAPLVPGAVPLEEQGRYESSRNFDDTVQYYYRKFRGTGLARWKNIVNLPTVRAKHLQSKQDKSKWLGINIYESEGKVRIYVIPRESVRAEAEAAAKASAN